MQAMLDIETLGNGNDRGFVITQIALIAFSFESADAVTAYSPADIYSRALESQYLLFNIDIEEQTMLGATIEPGTLKWWMSQDLDTFKSTFKGGIGVQEAITHIDRFIRYEGITNIWGNGKEFDNLALRRLYDRAEREFPLPFYTDQDLRTMAWLAGNPKRSSKQLHREGHNALSDAAAQIVDAYQYYRLLRAGIVSYGS